MTGRRITVTIRYDGGATVTVRASGGLAEAIMRTVTEYDEDISRRVEALDDGPTMHGSEDIPRDERWARGYTMSR